MTNMEKYVKAFSEALEVPESDVAGLVYGKSEAWDSVGHMTLIAALEDAFCAAIRWAACWATRASWRAAWCPCC